MSREKNTESRNIPWWLPSSLRHQLLLGVLVVVSVVLTAVGVVSVLSLRGYVTAMNDAEVAKSLHAFSHSYDRYRNGEQLGACRALRRWARRCWSSPDKRRETS